VRIIFAHCLFVWIFLVLKVSACFAYDKIVVNQRRFEKSGFEDQSEENSVWILKWTTLLAIFCKISFTPAVTSCCQIHTLNADVHLCRAAMLLRCNCYRNLAAVNCILHWIVLTLSIFLLYCFYHAPFICEVYVLFFLFCRNHGSGGHDISGQDYVLPNKTRIYLSLLAHCFSWHMLNSDRHHTTFSYVERGKEDPRVLLKMFSVGNSRHDLTEMLIKEKWATPQTRTTDIQIKSERSFFKTFYHTVLISINANSSLVRNWPITMSTLQNYVISRQVIEG